MYVYNYPHLLYLVYNNQSAVGSKETPQEKQKGRQINTDLGYIIDAKGILMDHIYFAFESTLKGTHSLLCGPKENL